MNKNLIDWYQQLNEEDILPNGAIKLHLPVLNTDVVISKEVEEPVDNVLANIRAKDDPVVIKDKAAIMRSFDLIAIIQHHLTAMMIIPQPYEIGSEQRQNVSTLIKEAYTKLGEEIAIL